MSQPKKYKAEVVSITNPVENIFAVEFRSMTGRFRYLPGQFMHLALDRYDPSFGWPESRCFSMQSSPGNELLKITYSVKGGFTTRMSRELKPGCEVDIKLPYGGLFQNEHSKNNVVFIAGGTGITPYISEFTDHSFIDYKQPKLYLGFRSPEYNIYENDLAKARENNPELEIKIKYQNSDGIFDVYDIFKENGIAVTYFLSGPQPMISSFRSGLIGLGVDQRLIKTDEWE